MKSFYAVYDKYDNFVDCFISYKEVDLSQSQIFRGLRRKEIIKSTAYKIFKIPLEPQDDIFNFEDKCFLEECKNDILTIKEQSNLLNVSERTIYRRKKQRGLDYGKEV